MQKWYKIVKIDEIPMMGARKVILDDKEIAIFKTRDESLFAIDNICPHKRGKLSEGLIHEHMVTCPLHNGVINLESGETLNEGYKCLSRYEIKLHEEYVYLKV